MMMHVNENHSQSKNVFKVRSLLVKQDVQKAFVLPTVQILSLGDQAAY